MIRKFLSTLVVLATVCGGIAYAQGLFSFSLAPNTVVGNARALIGPGQAIPFTTLFSQMSNNINTWLNTQTFSGGIGGLGLPINAGGSPYNADPTCTTDSTTAIQNAVNALPASGGIVLLPNGCYNVSSTLTLGNGTSIAGSTKVGMILAGTVPTQADIFGGFTVQPGVRLRWTGAANGTMLKVAGPLQGWGLQNLLFDCNNSSGTVGVNVVSAQYGDSYNLFFATCFAGISSSTVEPFGLFAITDSIHNSYRNMIFSVPNTLNAVGMVLQGSGSVTPQSNTDYNIIDNIYCAFPTAPTVAIFCLNIGVADSNFIRNMQSSNGNANVTGILFNYTVSANFPASNIIYGADPNGSIGTNFANSGTPNASARPNYIFGVIETNGTTVPNLANLAAYASGKIVLSPGANNPNAQITTLSTGVLNFNGGPLALASGGTGDTGSAWTTFTPSPSCGTATFTVNAARSKTLGKTTWVTVDITFATIGTCTTGGSPAFTFNWPNTVASTSVVNGQEFAHSNGSVTCITGAASSAVIDCIKNPSPSATTGTLVNWVVGDRMIVTGVYENQ